MIIFIIWDSQELYKPSHIFRFDRELKVA